MNIRTILLAGIFVLPISLSFAEDRYKCYRMSDASDNGYKQSADEYVDLTLDNGGYKSIIHLRSASKDVTFATCEPISEVNSNFYRWFETECKKLISVDGKSFTYEPYLIGSYAGISPIIDASYELHAKLIAASKKAMVKVPERTFVIFAEKKPMHEFFCYQQ
jgi:hypothetical protein